MSMKIIAVVLGGGMGRRVGARRPKQFEEVAGRPVMASALDLFESMPAIDGIVIVVPPDWVDFTRAFLSRNQYSKVLDVVPGGSTRQMSSFSGLILATRFGGSTLRKVVIHDAVRPFATAELVTAVISAADKTGAATAACRVTDTMYTVADGRVVSPVDRTGLWNAQTPQVFEPRLILDAHRAALASGVVDTSDDIQLVLRNGVKAVAVESDSSNLKITYPCDIKLLQKVLESR